jgi:hypothetical protein
MGVLGNWRCGTNGASCKLGRLNGYEFDVSAEEE